MNLFFRLSSIPHFIILELSILFNPTILRVYESEGKLLFEVGRQTSEVLTLKSLKIQFKKGAFAFEPLVRGEEQPPTKQT